MAVLAVSLPIYRSDPVFYWGGYYHAQPAYTAFAVGFVLAWLWLCQWIAERLNSASSPGAFKLCFRAIAFWSRNVTIIYLIQWTLILWIAAALLGYSSASLGSTLAMAGAVTVASHGSTVLFLHLRKRLAGQAPSATAPGSRTARSG